MSFILADYIISTSNAHQATRQRQQALRNATRTSYAAVAQRSGLRNSVVSERKQ